MKRILAGLLFTGLIMISTVSLNSLQAQPAPPPPPSAHGESGNKGGSAPLEDSISLTLALSLLYGGYAILKWRRRNSEI